MLGVSTKESNEVPFKGAEGVAGTGGGGGSATRFIALAEPGKPRNREGARACAIRAIHKSTVRVYDRWGVGIADADLDRVVARGINIKVRVNRSRGERNEAVAEEVI